MACKPGPSLGWKDDLGKPTPEKYFAWDNGSWRETTEDDLRELEEAESTSKNGHRRAGAKRTVNDDMMLEPMCTPEGVKDADDLLAKLQAKWGRESLPARRPCFAGSVLSRTGVDRSKFRKMLDQALVSQWITRFAANARLTKPL